MNKCFLCDAALSDWELQRADELGVLPCWCVGFPPGIPPTLANIAYAELCHRDLTLPVKVHDISRFVRQNCGTAQQHSIGVILSQDRRFCWAGRALYGLARHGPIPGARSLAEAAYAILLAAPRELHVEEVDFVLDQLNYRFNSDSLVHHLRGYTSNRWNLAFKIDHWSRIWVNTGRDARHAYNMAVRMCPTHAGFDSWLEDELAPKVERILEDRTRRLAELSGAKIDIPGDRIEFQ